MPYMISSRSVTNGVSLSVIKSKLVYKSMIFVENKLTSICLLIRQQLATRYFTYQVSSACLRTNIKASGACDIINHFAWKFAKCSPIFKILSLFHQQIKWYICNEVTHHNLYAWQYCLVIYHYSQYILQICASFLTFIFHKVVVRYAGFYAETCQSSGAQGEEAGKGIANGGARSEEGGAKCISVHTELLDH